MISCRTRLVLVGGSLVFVLASLLMADDVRVFLSSDGVSRILILNGRKLSLSELKQVLQPLRRVRSGVPELPLSVHPKTTMKDVIAVATELHAAGLTNLVVEMHEQPGETESAGIRLRVETVGLPVENRLGQEPSGPGSILSVPRQ